MGQYYLAVDIGASGGRHILGHIEDGIMKLEKVHHFENGMIEVQGKRLWDTKRLFDEIINGMKKCKELGKIPVSMSIDTWAVDYVLLDKEDHVLGDVYGYRDNRTQGMDKEVYQFINESSLYKRTGIQKQMFNTIYQLMAMKKQTPELLSQAKTFLMLPDYFQFLLTGKKVSEYTNATTTQLVSLSQNQWDKELIELLGYPMDMFLPLTMAGTRVGDLTKELQKEIGYHLEVLSCASHDTASAVMAMPKENGIYISSGTWSLMGIESEHAICDENSHDSNFTNEGGYEGRFRYLKNIMGLWMIQSVRHELQDAYSFAELCQMAEECREFSSRVDVNDSLFLAPENMTEAIKGYCRKTNQQIPNSIGEIAAVIYQSLAKCYGRTVREIEKNCGKDFDTINIVGGGSDAAYLNQLTANATGKVVFAGPKEATAIGNIIAQMIHRKELAGLKEARDCVYQSFNIKTYRPTDK